MKGNLDSKQGDHYMRALLACNRHLAQTCKARGWDKNTTPEVFLLLSEELGELAKEIRLHTGLKGETVPDNRENMTEEFADVLNYLLELANRFDVDLTSAYFKKHKINESRKRA